MKPSDIQCQFGDGPAVALFAFDQGCVCCPDAREQWLCEHHIHRATPLGGMELIRLAPGVRANTVAAIATAAVLCVSLLLSGCAQSTFFDNGLPIAIIRGDAVNVRYEKTGDHTLFTADSFIHSVATASAWHGINGALKTAALGAMAYGSGTTPLTRIIPVAGQVAAPLTTRAPAVWPGASAINPAPQHAP